MNRDEMIKFIVDCVAQTYRADAAGISESTNIPEQFGTKSLQRVSLCALIEKRQMWFFPWETLENTLQLVNWLILSSNQNKLKIVSRNQGCCFAGQVLSNTTVLLSCKQISFPLSR